MKIIKKGIPAGERLWKGTCTSCNSIVMAEQSELTHITHDQRDGSFSWEKCIVCKAGNNAGYGGLLFYPEKKTNE